MHYSVINPNIRDVIRHSTDKFIDANTSPKHYCPKDVPASNIFLLPLVSLISFLAGYNFHKLTKN